MTENKQLAIAAFNIIPMFSFTECEEGCKAFLEDIDDGCTDKDIEWLFPYILDRKLKFYEEEY